MEKSRKILISTIALGAIVVSGAIGAQAVFADSTSKSLSVVERLSQRFNLKSDDVAQVFEEERTERQQERRQQQEEKLNQFVTDGKITEEQKQLILNKCEERRTEQEGNRAKKGSMKNLTSEERQAEMEARKNDREAHREEMENWLKENGIDSALLSDLGLGGFQGGIHGGGHGGMRGGAGFNN